MKYSGPISRRDKLVMDMAMLENVIISWVSHGNSDKNITNLEARASAETKMQQQQKYTNKYD
jgi:hypothetical protein